jgi:hypothetical protein
MRPKLLPKLGFAPLSTEPTASDTPPRHQTLPTGYQRTNPLRHWNAYAHGADRTGTPPAPIAGAVRYPDPRTPRAARPTPAQNLATAS